jgi:hypothetical protein
MNECQTIKMSALVSAVSFLSTKTSLHTKWRERIPYLGGAYGTNPSRETHYCQLDERLP